jgi:ABC-type polysaccharide/polyol phosphate export permease
MKDELRELWRFRELLWTMIERELRIRYKNSAIGFLWSLLNPLVTMGVMWFVFTFFMNNQTPNYSAYIFAAYLPYLFFQNALMDSAQSVLAALPIVRKVYFPREILPLAVVGSNFVHFLLALCVFFAYLIFIWIRHGGSPFTVGVVYLPVLLVIQLALTTGLALLVSALNTFYEDVKYLLSVGLYLLFFLSPIMYFSEQVYYSTSLRARGGAFADYVYALYHLNPIASLCTAYRKLLLDPVSPIVNGEHLKPLPMDWGLLGLTALGSFAVLYLGYAVFNRAKWKFVERP